MKESQRLALAKGFITSQDIYPVYSYYNCQKMKRILSEFNDILYSQFPNLHDAAVCFIEAYNMRTTYKKTY